MNIDWHPFLSWMVGIAVNIPRLLGLAKKAVDLTQETLSTANTARGILESTKQFLEKNTTDEHPEQVADRVHAMADMTRSLAPFAFAEVLFYAIKTLSLILVFRWFVNLLTRRDARRIAEEMRKEQA